jgi:glycosyltransferase involved in cell wall biosynthesis
MPKSKNSVKSKPYTQIYICTPAYNSESTIEDTIKSIIKQKGNFELFYHIQDGGSSDSTVDILKKYQKLISSRTIDMPKIHFSFDSSKDEGMYYAILQGFSNFSMTGNNWMTWINSDDQLAVGALDFIAKVSNNPANADVKWLGGRTSVMDQKGKLTEFLLPMSSEIIENGVADGIHWGYFQQEGVFFRHSLWKKIDTKKNFTDFKYAGDWCLWYAFSHYEKLFQVDKALGTFYKRKGQLSEVNREEYEQEIDDYLSRGERFNKFNALHKVNRVRYEITNDTNVTIEEKPLNGAIQYWQKRRKSEGLIDVSAHTIISDNIIAFDNEWQFPAITEQYAFQQLQKSLGKTNKDVIYFAFPWATLIDLLNNKKPASNILLYALKSFKKSLKNKKVITVCQHIFMMKYQHLFDEMGVSDIYWTHAIHNQPTTTDYRNINIHPFPLFPVQAIGFEDEKDMNSREHLFSFVGARANKWYLTESRNMIIDLLTDSPEGKVIGRDTWHYHKAVYEHQVNKGVSKGTDLVDKDTTAEFKDILRESVFALCPSGSGPNSIRLWEAMGYGVIPVILADTYLPPGNEKLWEEAVVYCKEDEESIKKLPLILSDIAKNKELLQRKRNAIKQLWLMYGPDCFVYDILKGFIQHNEQTINTQSKLLSCKEVSLFCNDSPNKDWFLLSCTSKLLLDHKAFLNDFYNSEENIRNLKQAINSKSKYLNTFNQVLSLKNIELSVD